MASRNRNQQEQEAAEAIEYLSNPMEREVTLKCDRGNIHSCTSITIVPQGRLDDGVYYTDIIVSEQRDRAGVTILHLHEMTLFHKDARLSAQIVERDELWRVVPTVNEDISLREAESIRGGFERALAAFEAAYRVARSRKDEGSFYLLNSSAHINLRTALLDLFADLYESDCGRFVRLAGELKDHYGSSIFLTGLEDRESYPGEWVEGALFSLRDRLLADFERVTGEAL